jgi:hypothetical protein
MSAARADEATMSTARTPVIARGSDLRAWRIIGHRNAPAGGVQDCGGRAGIVASNLEAL